MTDAMQEIVAREERLRLAAEAADQTIWDWDLRRNKITWSGYDLEAHVGLAPGTFGHRQEDFLALVHPEDREFVERSVERALAENIVYDIEFRFMRGDGTFCWVASRGRPLRDARGKPVRMIGVARDISRRKLAEEALRESEERLRLAVEATNQTIWDLDLEHDRITWWGYDLEAHLGLAPGAFGRRQEDFIALVHPEDRKFVERARNLALAGGSEYDIEFRYFRPDGSVFWVTSKGKVVRNAHGRPIRMIGVSRDISEHKRAEQALRESEERYRVLVEALPDGVMMSDLEHKILACNQRAADMHGYTKSSELLGMDCLQLVDPSQREVALAARSRMLTHGTIRSEFILLRKDGSSFAGDTTGTALRGAGGAPYGFVMIIRDISDQKRAEQERLHLKDKLRQAQKMEALGRLAGGVAHDFNNVLTVMNGYTELALRRLPSRHAVRPMLNEVTEAGERAARLIGQLLAFSRHQVLDPKVLDLNKAIASVEEMLRRVIGEDIELTTRCGCRVARVRVDRNQIVQVLVNLAVNARDAMPRGGRLTIETRNANLTEAECGDIPGAAPGPYVLLAVSDTGVGMSRDVMERIFDPFFTTKEPGVGTGLGLATVYGIVEQSGGHVHVQSQQGQGSTFRIYLPRAKVRPGKAAARSANGQPVRGKETVLVVEDELAVRNFAVAALRLSGYKVLDAGSGRGALLLLRQHKGPVHLVLTDVIMSGMDGRELADRIRIIHPQAKVLFISGYTDVRLRRSGVSDTKICFLRKPFTIKALTNKVREVLKPSSHRFALSGASRRKRKR